MAPSPSERERVGVRMRVYSRIIRVRTLGGGLRPPSEPPPRPQCEPQDVAGLGPRRPRRAIRKSEPQDVAGLGPRRPRRAIRKSEPQDVAGLGPRRPRRAIRKSEPQDVAGLGPRRPRRAIRNRAGKAGARTGSMLSHGVFSVGAGSA